MMKPLIRFYWPLLLLILLQVVFTGYVMGLDSPENESIFGHSVAFLSLLMFCFLMPATVMMGACYLGYISYLSLKCGQFPPPDVPGFTNSKVKTGLTARLIACLGLLMPVLSVGLLWLGIESYSAIVADQHIQAIQTGS